MGAKYEKHERRGTFEIFSLGYARQMWFCCDYSIKKKTAYNTRALDTCACGNRLDNLILSII